MQDAIGYIRVSSEEQADSGLGLAAQRQRIAAYCTMKGLHLAEVFEDPGISAGKPLAGRPAGSRLLAAAKKGKAVVVVAKLDRLFRSVADAATGSRRSRSSKVMRVSRLAACLIARPPQGAVLPEDCTGRGREPRAVCRHGRLLSRRKKNVALPDSNPDSPTILRRVAPLFK